VKFSLRRFFNAFHTAMQIWHAVMIVFSIGGFMVCVFNLGGFGIKQSHEFHLYGAPDDKAWHGRGLSHSREGYDRGGGG
jgi:hypothetical protein